MICPGTTQPSSTGSVDEGCGRILRRAATPRTGGAPRPRSRPGPPPTPARSASGRRHAAGARTPATCGPSPTCGPGVHVEQPDLLDDVADRARGRADPDRVEHVGGGHRRRRPPARRPPCRRGTSRPAPPGPGSGDAAASTTSRSSSNAAARAGRPSAVTTFGCSSPAWPDEGAVGRRQARAPTRVPRRVVGVGATRRAPPRRPPRPGARPRSRRCGRPGDRAPTSRPAPAGPRGRRRPGAAAAARRRRSPPGPRRTAGPRPAAAGAAGAPATGRVTSPSSKIATSVSPAAHVAPRGVEQRDQQVGAQVRLLVGERVDQPHGATTGVVRGQAQRVELVGPDERVAEHLDETGLGQRPRDRAPGPLARGQARDRPGRRGASTGSRRTRAAARPPRPGRRRPRGRAATTARVTVTASAPASRHVAADRPQRLAHLVGRERHADEPRGQVERELERRHGHATVDVRERARDAAAVLDQERDRPRDRHRRQLGVDAALEPLGRLAGQLVPARGAGDRDRVEVRGLDEQVGRRRADLAVPAAHDGRETDGPGTAHPVGAVGDEQVLGVERAVDVVERRGSARPGSPAAPRSARDRCARS